MGYTVIAPAGDNLKALFVGMKEFPTEKVIFITPKSYFRKTKAMCKRLEDFTIQSEMRHVEGNLFEEMFSAFGDICSKHDHDSLIVNVATGDRMSTCAALSAAFANGLKAIGVVDKQCMLLPIMKLSYYNELSDNKLNILRNLPKDEYTSLRNVSNDLKISASLLSYHINGTMKYKGLKEFRLVDVKEDSKNTFVKLSDLGKLLLKGHISPR